METKNISPKSIEIEKWFKKGYKEIEAKRWDYAIIVFEKILAMDKNNKDASLAILKTHEEHANYELQNKNWGKASEIADTLLSLNPNESLPYRIKLLAISQKLDFDNDIFLDLFFTVKDEKKVQNKNIITHYKNFLLHTNKEFTDIIINNAKESIYNIACHGLHSGDISAVASLLKYIEDYKDITDRFFEAKYQRACNLANTENVSEIIEAKLHFEELGEYRDAATKAYLCDSYITLDEKASYHQKQYILKRKQLQSQKNDIKRSFSLTTNTLSKQELFFRTSTLLFIFALILMSILIITDTFIPEYIIIFSILFFIFCAATAKEFGADKDAPTILQLLFPLFMLFALIYVPVQILIDLINIVINIVKSKKMLTSSLKKYNLEISELEVKLKYLLETTIGDEVETFESEAEGIGFMVGYGKALIEKYSSIPE